MTQFTKDKIYTILNELEENKEFLKSCENEVNSYKNAENGLKNDKKLQIFKDVCTESESSFSACTYVEDNCDYDSLLDDEDDCDVEYADDDWIVPGDHSGHKERLRRKALEDITSLSEHEMLELLLNFSIIRKNTNRLAHELIARYGTLANVCNTSVENLMQVRGLGKVSASLLNLLPKIIEVYKNSLLNLQGAIITRGDLKMYFKRLLEMYKNETAFALCLDKNNQILDCITLGKGTVDQIKLPIIEAVPLMLESHPHKVVLGHNHLTNNAQPSFADVSYTQKLKETLERAGVMLYDHIIIAKEEIFSFAENNLL